MTPRNKKKNNFWHKIRFKYKLILLNESTLEDLFSIRISQLTVFLAGLLLAVTFLFFIIFLIVGTPLRNYLPGYLDTELRTELVESRMRLDSLTEQNQRRTIYLENIKRILKGEIQADSITKMDSLVIIPPDSLPVKSIREQQFINRFEEEEKYNLTILSPNSPGDGLIFYPPVKGVILNKFDAGIGNIGIDLLCAKNATVASPLEGTVIFVEYTLSDGYIMTIQHEDNYVSVFKNLRTPMRKVGQRIEAGNMIGVMGRDRETEKENQLSLHYQLWHNGYALDPQKYISF